MNRYGLNAATIAGAAYLQGAKNVLYRRPSVAARPQRVKNHANTAIEAIAPQKRTPSSLSAWGC
jgi:hypothetical protein